MARIPEHEIEQIKQQVLLIGLIEADGTALKKQGKDYAGCGPFHEDATPSLIVTPTKKIWLTLHGFFSLMVTDTLKSSELPEWFSYPEEFSRAVQSGLRDVGPWQILDGNWLRVRCERMKRRFPSRDLVPFARRPDSDDVACWDRKTLPAVQVATLIRCRK
ncbi:hypothetical protein ABIE56_003697 [Luteibacter sp. 621]|uniref:CHC2 zinc finger domain-containing protein n=1 Tax=Luteibacter sp. 621 TaxID=3373916 RepID=UPI003D1BF85D